jgi:FkbM family methyltransferase
MKEKIGLAIRNLFEYITGWTVYAINPRGAGLHKDINEYLEGVEINRIFDVGAHKGYSTKTYKKHYPGAEIHSFEPVQSTFEVLKKELKKYERVECHNIAIGNKNGKSKVVLESTSNRYRLKKHHNDIKDVSKEEVQIKSIDSFCSSKRIESVDFLKIDTEGNDLEVIKGAEKMIKNKNIKLIQAELAANPTNGLHADFENVKSYMRERGYMLFSIYEQRGEWEYSNIPLRRIDAVFVSDKVYL